MTVEFAGQFDIDTGHRATNDKPTVTGSREICLAGVNLCTAQATDGGFHAKKRALTWFV